MSKRFPEIIFRLVTIIVGTWVIFNLIVHIRAEILWFQEVNYLATLIKRWQTQFLLWIFTCGTSSLFLLRNLHIAHELAWRWSPKQNVDFDSDFYLPPKHEELKLEQKKTHYFLSKIRGRNSNINCLYFSFLLYRFQIS